MLDSLLDVGASFDWISPMLGFLGDVMNGPSHTFLIPYGSCPISGYQIARMLRKRGVKSWGRMIVSGTFMITVRLEKARWAQHLLEQAGVPIENPLPETGDCRSSPRRRAATLAQRGTRGSRRRSEAGSLVEAVSEILDSPLF
jgi:hypothetical protein